MGMPAAKKNDLAVGIDVHIVMVPAPPGAPVPTPLPHPFSGPLDQQLSPDVTINGQPAATKGSVATNRPSHFPTPPGVSFQTPPATAGTDVSSLKYFFSRDSTREAGATAISSTCSSVAT